ncbi:MAG: hypothetical protein RR235_09615 [Oscillospiraceae bacterium]
MKVLTITVGGTTYTTARITTGMSREAMRVNAQSLKYYTLAEQAVDADDKNAAAADLINIALELSDRKLNLICRVYGEKFALSQLEDSLTNEEIDVQISSITSGISGVISKN